MDARLRDLLDTHDGLLTTSLAGRVGVTRPELVRAVRARDLVRLRHGSYVELSRWERLAPWERFALRGRAALLARPASLLARHSGLAAHGLPLFDVDLERVDVVDEVKHPFRRGGLVVEPRGSLLQAPEGLRAVALADCLVQTLSTFGHGSALIPLDAALHRGLVTREAVGAAGPQPGYRGHERVVRLLAQADDRCESPGETRTRIILRGLGVEVRSQVAIPLPGRAARVDFLVEGKVVVEFDGAVKYEGAEGRAALMAEKAREDGLRALGFEVVRLTWRDLDHPARVAALVRAALARAQR